MKTKQTWLIALIVLGFACLIPRPGRLREIPYYLNSFYVHNVKTASPDTLADQSSPDRLVSQRLSVLGQNFMGYQWDGDNTPFLKVERDVEPFRKDGAALEQKRYEYAGKVRSNIKDAAALFGCSYPDLIQLKDHEITDSTYICQTGRKNLEAAWLYAPHSYELGRWLLFSYQDFRQLYPSSISGDPVEGLAQSLLEHSPGDEDVTWALACYEFNRSKPIEAVDILKPLVKKHPENGYYVGKLSQVLDQSVWVGPLHEAKARALAGYREMLPLSPAGSQAHTDWQRWMDALAAKPDSRYTVPRAELAALEARSLHSGPR